MEVRPGYKRTEVGVIPGDWSDAALSSLIENGSRITYGVVKPGRNDIDGVLFIRGGDIFAGRINEAQLRRIPKAVSAQYKRTCLSGGEILISLVGYPGEAALVPQHLGGANIARQVALLRLNKNLPVSPQFVCTFLQSDVGRRQLLKEAIGSAQQVINLRDIQKVAVALPPTEAEQRAIAAALTDVDALLGGLDRLIAKKRDLKQAAMQQLLTGQTRLPGFHGEWEVKPLGALGTWKGGMTPSMGNPRYWEGGEFPWISSGDVKVPRLTDTSQHVTSSAVREGAAVVVPAQSIVLVTRSGILRKFLPVALVDRPMAINQDIKALIPDEAAGGDFLLHALLGYGDQILASCLKAGTTVESVEFPWLKAFTIPIPPRKEQDTIASVLSDMDAELAALEARRDKTRALKQGMMQELLTGRTRLVRLEDEEAVAC